VTLLLPIAVLSYHLASIRAGAAMRAYLIATLAGVALLMTSTSTFKLFPRWDETAKLAQVYGAYVWVYLILMLALVIVLRRRDEVAETSAVVVRDETVLRQ
jgi:hypothetical protein